MYPEWEKLPLQVKIEKGDLEGKPGNWTGKEEKNYQTLNFRSY